MPTHPDLIPTRLNTRDFLQRHIQVLEDLLGPDWFKAHPQRTASPPSHPALNSWRFLRYVAGRRGRLRSPLEAAFLLFALLDNTHVVACSDGDVARLRVGGYGRYGKAAAVAKMKKRLRDPKQFASQMTEFAIASHFGDRADVIPITTKSSADLRVNFPDHGVPLIIECKTLQQGTGPDRCERIVKKANLQIKGTDEPAYGMLVVDMRETGMAFTPRHINEPPPPVRAVALECERLLNRELCCSVSAALIVWNRCHFLGQPKPGGKSLVFLERRSILIPHRHARTPLLLDFYSTEIAFTTMIQVSWADTRG